MNVLLRCFSLAAILAALPLVLPAQSFGRQDPVEILETGGLMSTPSFSAEESEAILKTVPAIWWPEIQKLVNESSWPEGISTLSGRNNVRPEMNNYRAFIVAEYGSTVLLHLPAIANQHMEPPLRPEKDIFFLIAKSSVSFDISEEKIALWQSAMPAMPPVPTRVSTLQEGLNTVLTYYPHNFQEMVKEDVTDTTGVSLQKEYSCHFEMPGATETRVVDPMLGSPAFHAQYGEFKDLETAEAAFADLRKQVAEVKFDCCTFVRNFSPGDAIQSEYYLPFDLSGKMDPAYQDVVVETTLIKGIHITPEFKVEDVWYLKLSVRHNE